MPKSTKLVPANIGDSLRTTIPIHIIRQLNLFPGDRVDWELDKGDDGTWFVIVRKADE